MLELEWTLQRLDAIFHLLKSSSSARNSLFWHSLSQSSSFRSRSWVLLRCWPFQATGSVNHFPLLNRPSMLIKDFSLGVWMKSLGNSHLVGWSESSIVQSFLSSSAVSSPLPHQVHRPTSVSPSIYLHTPLCDGFIASSNLFLNDFEFTLVSDDWLKFSPWSTKEKTFALR